MTNHSPTGPAGADADSTAIQAAESVPVRAFMVSACCSAQAGVSLKHGGPFGASVVRHGRIISCEHNTVLCETNPTRHAEMNAIRVACGNLRSEDLSDCELYTSCEPCPMCWGAITCAGIAKENVYIGVDRVTAADFGFDDSVFYTEIVELHESFTRLSDSSASAADPDRKKAVPFSSDFLTVEIGTHNYCARSDATGRVDKDCEFGLNWGDGDALVTVSKKSSNDKGPKGQKDSAEEEDNTDLTNEKKQELLRQAMKLAVDAGTIEACLIYDIVSRRVVGQGVGTNSEKSRRSSNTLSSNARSNTNCMANSLERDLPLSPMSDATSAGSADAFKFADATSNFVTKSVEEACMTLDTYVLENCVAVCTLQPDVMGLASFLWSRMPHLLVAFSLENVLELIQSHRSDFSLVGSTAANISSDANGNKVESAQKTATKMKSDLMDNLLFAPIDRLKLMEQQYIRFYAENKVRQPAENTGIALEECAGVFAFWQKENGVIY